MRHWHQFFILFVLLVDPHLVNRVSLIVLLEACELLLPDEFVLTIVDAFFLPFFSLEVVLDKFAVGLVLEEEAELAVAVEAGELALIAIRPAAVEAAFLDHGDPVLLLRVNDGRVWAPVAILGESSEVHEPAVSRERRRNIFIGGKLMLVWIDHLRLPITYAPLCHFMERVQDLALLLGLD